MADNEPYSMLNEIQSLVEDKQLSFLIGAGFSKNISKEFPTWKELLADAIWNMYGTGNDADRPKKGSRIEKEILHEHSLLDIASKVVKDAGYHEAIDNYIELHTPYLEMSGKSPVLMKDGVPLPNSLTFDCHTLLRQLNVSNIYTFNYDNALEFCLGDKHYLAGKKREIQKKIKDAKDGKQAIEDQIKNLKRSPLTDPSLDGSVPRVELSSKDTNTEAIQKDLSVLNMRRNEEITIILELEAQEKNIDKEIEQSYLVVKKASDIALTASGHNIYKIHGDLRIKKGTEYGFDGDKHVQYIITQEDYETYELKHSAFVNLMRIDLLRNRFCIIGVAGGDANFLGWINWVKDVLDKTEKESEKKLSYFIYAGNDDLGRSMQQMLKNHFIVPIVLKDLFPKSVNETERVKSFLEYIQPKSTLQTERLTRLWKEVDRRSWGDGTGIGTIGKDDLEELCGLSTSLVFHKALSPIHHAARDVQDSAFLYLKDISNISRTKLYAAALRCSLLPILRKQDERVLAVLRKSGNLYVKEAYRHAHNRMRLLANPAKLPNSNIADDAYTSALKRLFLFDFPMQGEYEFECKTGLDYVRLYSLQMLLTGQSSVNLDLAQRAFSSPQEQVLAVDWLAWLNPNIKSPIVDKAKKFKKQYSTFHLSDYFQSYLTEMREKKDVPSYGNLQESIHIDGWYSGVENAAVILNSIVELGICFNGHTVLQDDDWAAVSCELASVFPYPIVFYTIARKSRDCVIKRVAQELIYDNSTYQVVPDILLRLMRALVSDNTPKQLIVPITKFAQELFVAIPVLKWGHLFKQIVVPCLDLADKTSSILLAKSLYQFISEGMAYMPDKRLKILCLNRVLSNISFNEHIDNQLNALAISAAKGLTQKDFSSLSERLVAIAGKPRTKKIENYVLINLADLLSLRKRRKVSAALEKQAIRDKNLAEAFAFLIQGDKNASEEYKKKLTSRKDVWQCGVEKGTISPGEGCIKITRIDRFIHFNKTQVVAIFNDLKTVVGAVKRMFDMPGREVVDKGWMSEENTFREAVMDMMVFVHLHQEELETQDGYDHVVENLQSVYSHCMYGKTLLQLLADDKTYMAIRGMMTQTELKGIDILQPEYEALLGKMLTRSSKEVNICFQHVAWAIKEYDVFFSNDSFISLEQAILDSYAQYFLDEKQRSWDIAGCEKETAEKYLVSMAQTLKEHGYPHPFWEHYERKYFVT